MTDIGCGKTLAVLEEYLHNELGADFAADVAEHLSGCGDCTDEHKVGLVLSAAIKRAGVEIAPEDLHAAVRQRLRAIELTS
jgi:anti-sigma factor (TIGR02949 family)